SARSQQDGWRVNGAGRQNDRLAGQPDILALPICGDSRHPPISSLKGLDFAFRQEPGSILFERWPEACSDAVPLAALGANIANAFAAARYVVASHWHMIRMKALRLECLGKLGNVRCKGRWLFDAAMLAR